MTVKFLGVQWFSGRSSVGLVKYKNSVGEIKYVIGAAQSFNEEADIKWIIDWGTKIDPDHVIHFLSEKHIPEKIKECYRLGYDCGKNEPNETNCAFSIFSSPEQTEAWHAGKKDAEAGKPSLY